jgi:hypothetical protein
MPIQKKRWERPQLIVLGRGTPEENVLTACKQVERPVINPIVSKQNCKSRGDYDDQVEHDCSECRKLTTT